DPCAHSRRAQPQVTPHITALPTFCRVTFLPPEYFPPGKTLPFSASPVLFAQRARRPRRPIAIRYSATIRFSSLGIMRINIPAIKAARGANETCTYIDNLRLCGSPSHTNEHSLGSKPARRQLASFVSLFTNEVSNRYAR